MRESGDHDVVRAFEQERRRLRARQSVVGLGVGAAFLVAVVSAGRITELSPVAILEGLPEIGVYFAKTVPELRWETLGADLAAWYHDLETWLLLLLDTLLIAVMASLAGVGGALLLCFSASRNLAPHYTVYFVARRLLEFARTVPEVVWALVFVVAFGVGPLAGFLALAVHSVGALGKLYAEVNENVEWKPIEALQAVGANRFEVLRFGVLPQVSPGYATYTLWRVELNLRAAAILGFVGAGGIGAELHKAISFHRYEDISALLLLIIGTVVVLDLVSEAVRHRIIGAEQL